MAIVISSSPSQRRRFVGQVFEVARRRRGEFDTLAAFRSALIVDADGLGRRRVPYAMRLQVARAVAGQVWGEPVDEVGELEPEQRAFLEGLGSSLRERRE